MPQKLLVSKTHRVEDTTLTLPVDLKHINHSKPFVLTCPLDVQVNHLGSRVRRWQELHAALELQVVLIHRVDKDLLLRRILGELVVVFVKDPACNLDVKQVSDQVILGFDSLLVSDHEVSHLLEAKVVRDIRVELSAEVQKLALVIGLDSVFNLAQDLIANKHSLL